MRKLALVVALLPIAACSSWGSGGLTQEQKDKGIKSVSALSSDYESGTFWTRFRQRNDGRANAFGRDLGKVQEFFDRHFWNYDINDPYINYPTDTGRFTHTGRFIGTTVTSVPYAGDVIAWGAEGAASLTGADGK